MALLAVSLPGCIEVATVLTLEGDGSGTITEEILLSDKLREQVEKESAAGAPNPLKRIMDEKRHEERAPTFGEGVKFVKTEQIEKHGAKGVRVTYAFEDINHVKFRPGGAIEELKAGVPGEEETKVKTKSRPVTFKFADKKLTLNFPKDPRPRKPRPGKERAANPQEETVMKETLRGVKTSAKLVIEPGIAGTDASHVDGNTIVLRDLDFGKIVGDPGGIKALLKMDRGGRAEMEKHLKGLDGVTVEFKDTVEVTLK